VTATSRVLIRLALLHFVGGSALGAWMLAAKAVASDAGARWAFPLHVELLLYGWIFNLVFGVAHWILPRLPGRDRDAGRLRVWAAALLLNAGIGLVALSVGLSASSGAAVVIEAAGRALQGGAAALFVLHAWKRVRPYGPALRRP
jgi:hypothetical protein